MLAEVTTATAPTGISEELWLGATAGLSALSATDGSTSSTSSVSSVSDFLDTLTTSKPAKVTAARRYRMWNLTDTQTLMRMVSEKQSWDAISVACGHPESGCRDKYLRMSSLTAIGYRRSTTGAPTQVGRKPTWKPEETQTLIRMVSEYCSWEEIKAACNHSKGACRAKYIRLTGKSPPLLTGWPSQAKRTRKTVMSSMYADIEPLHARMELSLPPTESQLPSPPTQQPQQSSPPSPPTQQPQHPQQSSPPPPLPSYPRPQPLSSPPAKQSLPHQQQFVANVNTLATKMCTKMDPKAMQLCNAMFQLLMTVMPEESATSS